MGDYINSMAEGSQGMFEEYILNTGQSYTRSTTATLTAAKIARERAAAARSIQTQNINASEETFDLAAAGDLEAAKRLLLMGV